MGEGGESKVKVAEDEPNLHLEDFEQLAQLDDDSDSELDAGRPSRIYERLHQFALLLREKEAGGTIE